MDDLDAKLADAILKIADSFEGGLTLTTTASLATS